MLNQKDINLYLIDKFKRSCLDIAVRNENTEIIGCLNEKLKEFESLDLTDVDLDLDLNFFPNETNPGLTSSNKPTTSTELEEHISSLEEFYKKRTFAKSLSSKQSSSNLKAALIKESAPQSTISNVDSIPINSKWQKPKWASKNWDILLADDENSDEDKANKNSDDDSSDDERESSKKKRLSMSPLNKIEDTLFWLKDQSKKSSSYFENKELSLTGIFS